MALTKWQDRLLYVYCFTTNFQELRVIGTATVSIPAIVAAFYVLLIATSAREVLAVRRRTGAEPLLFLFCIYLIAINLLNISEDSSKIVNIGIIANASLFFVLSSHLIKRPHTRRSAAISVSLGAALLSIAYLAGIGVEVTEAGRTKVFGDNENIIGLKTGVGAIIIICALFDGEARRLWKRIPLALGIAPMLALLVETGSRVAILSLATMMLLLILLTRQNVKVRIALVFVVGVCVSYLYSTIAANEIILTRILLSLVAGDIGGRESIYEGVWAQARKHWMMGIGETGYFSSFGEESPHNVILEILAYTGVVGLTLFIASLFRISKSALKALRTWNDPVPILMLIPVAGMMMSGQLLTVKYGWLLLALAAGGGADKNLLSRNTESRFVLRRSKPVGNSQ